MDRMEHTRALRANSDVHYNCCQAVLVPFAADMGLTEAQGYALGSHFWAGMRHGSTCGALAGALMVLGALGFNEKQALSLVRLVRETHGATDCTALLQASHNQGQAKKAHCDALVYEMTAALEGILSGGQP